MSKVPLTLAQLCMMFRGCKMIIYGAQIPAEYELDVPTDAVFKLPQRVKDIELVHCSSKPMPNTFSYYIGIKQNGKEEVFAFVGMRKCSKDVRARDVIFLDLCDFLIGLARVDARRIKNNIGKKNDLTKYLLGSCFNVQEPLAVDNSVRTEIIWRLQVIWRFDTAITIPFDCVEQRKNATADGIIMQTWGYDEDSCFCDMHSDKAVSQVWARFYPDDESSDPVDIPLRTDGTNLPLLLYDYALLLGISWPPENDGNK